MGSPVSPDPVMDKIEEQLAKGQAIIDATADATMISVLIDASGSMSGVKQQTINGFNQFVEEQKKVPGKAFLTLTLFDTNVKVEYVATPLDQVPALTTATYRPGGGTALWDAQGITIDQTAGYLASLSAQDRPSKVIFLTMTDGGENSSKDFTDPDQLKKIIDAKTEADGWLFVYTGANQDSYLIASKMGYKTTNTANYAGTATGTSDSFRKMSTNTSRTRTYAGATGQSMSASAMGLGGFYADDAEASAKLAEALTSGNSTSAESTDDEEDGD